QRHVFPRQAQELGRTVFRQLQQLRRPPAADENTIHRQALHRFWQRAHEARVLEMPKIRVGHHCRRQSWVALAKACEDGIHATRPVLVSVVAAVLHFGVQAKQRRGDGPGERLAPRPRQARRAEQVVNVRFGLAFRCPDRCELRRNRRLSHGQQPSELAVNRRVSRRKLGNPAAELGKRNRRVSRVPTIEWISCECVDVANLLL
ncbi:MAG: hypothetical protein ACI8W8_003127, partial [Rhodothermales bacterium]